MNGSTIMRTLGLIAIIVTIVVVITAAVYNAVSGKSLLFWMNVATVCLLSFSVRNHIRWRQQNRDDHEG